MISSRLESYFTQYKELVYVIAYGSIGRGESPFVKNTEGKDQLYNDLDLILVSKNKPQTKSYLTKIKEDIKGFYGVKWVDLIVWDEKQLKKKRRSIFYFDLCFKHLLLKGNRNTLDKILKPYPQDKISTYDFYCMYHTRLWAVMSLLCDEKGNNDLSSKQFKSYQCAKAIIAICDFFLFSYSKYTPMVKDKLKHINFESNKSIGEFLSVHLANAIDVKLNPDSKALYYFIEDDFLVLELLEIYEFSFFCLQKSRHKFPSLALFNISLQTEILAVSKAVLLRSSSVLVRNIKRKKLHKLFKRIIHNGKTTSTQNKINTLPALLKELSE